MVEKWLEQDEGIILEGRAFVWIKPPFPSGGSWSKLYLTNKRFYARDRIFGMKLVDLPYSKIKSVSSDKKYLKIQGEVKDKQYQIKIRKKSIEPSWEWMIRQRLGQGAK